MIDYSKEDFGDGFKWGASAAAYQTEGAWNIDGKGESIWDVFANTKGKIYLDQNANTSCDFYHHYAQDIAIMSQLNIPNFRFSLSWSRIMPNGTGAINYKGVDFYHRVIDFCLELGIEPWITLYHWDLPQALEQKGGWTNRSIIDWFGDYVEFCIKTFGDKVKRWFVLNEPMVFTGAGYFLGVHAPGRRGLNSFLAAAHHAALCQAHGGRIIKSLQSDSFVGTTFSCSFVEPYRDTPKDQFAAIRVDALLNRLFVEPLLGLGYPVDSLAMLNRMEPFVKDGDEAALAFDMDFIGVQNYTREIIAYSHFRPLIWANIISANRRNVETTAMNWEVHPPAIYEMLMRFGSYKNVKEIIVTENGAAFTDEVINGEVRDTRRQLFLKQYLANVLRAQRDGVNVTGYFVWSFTDNFEWAEGFRPRFGLVYIDFKTQQRIIKSSGHWYGKLLQDRAFASIAV